MAHSILITDDDLLLSRSLAYNLTQAGYNVQIAGSAEEAIDIVKGTAPDLVLLDVGLPGMDGLQALHHLRESVPVIMLTARRRELDEILGLEMGARDYVVKPFQFDVLLARIRAALRHKMPVPHAEIAKPIISGDLILDPDNYSLMISGRSIGLAPLEFRLLWALTTHPGRVFSIEELLNTVWGVEYRGEMQIVYVYIHSLREKIELDPRRPVRIVTVHSRGYKYMSQEAHA